jgi:Baseplate J-like protein
MSRVIKRTAPDIDSRSVNDIVSRIKALIPFYVPGWQPHDKSAGHALLYIFAHMLEDVIDQLDKVPDKHLISFLDRIGIKPLPSQSAQAPVTFSLTDGTLQHVQIAKKARVASGEIFYETLKSIVATPAKLVEAFSIHVNNDKLFPAPPHIVKGIKSDSFETYLLYGTTANKAEIFVAQSDGFVVGDHLLIGGTEYGVIKEIEDTQITLQDPLSSAPHKAFQPVQKVIGFKLFNGSDVQQHNLFLGDNDLFTGKGQATITLQTGSAANTKRLSDSKYVTWEFWGEENGVEEPEQKWYELTMGSISTKEPKEFTLTKPGTASFKERDINGIKSRWIRCKSKLIDSVKDLYLDTIKAGVSAQLKQAQMAFYNNVALDLTLDNNKAKFKSDIYPFGTRPRTLDTFYIGSSEVFSLKGETITIIFTYGVQKTMTPKTGLQLSWQYWNGDGWVAIKNLDDQTKMFFMVSPQSVTFSCPMDIAKTSVNGQENLWIRVKIATGDYGKEIYKKKGTEPNITYEEDPSKIYAPKISFMTLSCTSKLSYPNYCVTFNHLDYIERSSQLHETGKGFFPFEAFTDSANSLYLAFDQQVKKGPVSLFFAILEQLDSASMMPHVQWQYYNRDKGWLKLEALDRTRGLTRTGAVEFAFPRDFHEKQFFGKNRWWIRAVVKQTGAAPIIIEGIYLNTTWVEETVGGESGNVDEGEIKDLKSSIPFMDKASNPMAASGGANQEAVADTLIRGPLTLRHRNRAVTAEDYEDIAKEASRSVAKVTCLPNTDMGSGTGTYKPGWITVVIVPLSTDAKPQLTLQLKERVETGLKSHAPFMLVESNAIQVIAPSYMEVSITATLAVTAMEKIMPVENQSVRQLDDFLHPLTGAEDGCGWGLGLMPCFSDFYRLLEQLEGVDHVVSLALEVSLPQQMGAGKKYTVLPDVTPEFTISPNALVCTGTHKITASYQKQ